MDRGDGKDSGLIQVDFKSYRSLFVTDSMYRIVVSENITTIHPCMSLMQETFELPVVLAVALVGISHSTVRSAADPRLLRG